MNSDNKIFAEFLNKYIKDFKISSNKIEFLASHQNDNIKQSNSFASIQFENYQKMFGFAFRVVKNLKIRIYINE